MAELTKSAEQVPGLRDLIEAWCDRRCLNALKYVLPAYLSFNGRIDGWSMLCAAVRNARTFAHDELTEGELETICLIVRSAKEIITARLRRQGDRLQNVLAAGWSPAAERLDYVDWRRLWGVVDLIQSVPWPSWSNPSAAKSHSQF